MYNFRPENQNHLNHPDRWSFLQGDAGYGVVKLSDAKESIGFSYFLQVQEHFEEMIKSTVEKYSPQPKTLLEKIANVFKPEPQVIQDTLIKERIIQGFSATTLTTSIASNNEAYFVEKVNTDRLKEEIKASNYGFLVANGYGNNIYKLYIEDDKIKVLRYKRVP